MDEESNAAKLRLARRLISSVRKDLDISKVSCEHCDLSRYNNWLHHQWDDTLKGASQRLSRLVDAMERDEEKSAT